MLLVYLFFFHVGVDRSSGIPYLETFSDIVVIIAGNNIEAAEDERTKPEDGMTMHELVNSLERALTFLLSESKAKVWFVLVFPRPKYNKSYEMSKTQVIKGVWEKNRKDFNRKVKHLFRKAQTDRIRLINLNQNLYFFFLSICLTRAKYRSNRLK